MHLLYTALYCFDILAVYKMALNLLCMIIVLTVTISGKFSLFFQAYQAFSILFKFTFWDAENFKLRPLTLQTMSPVFKQQA